MARLSLKLAGYPWDHITPLLRRASSPCQRSVLTTPGDRATIGGHVLQVAYP